jgi:vacuolar protein sorting-associated protein 1
MLNEEPTGYHFLQHGYYCVRLADDDERSRGIGREEMTIVEETFFEGTEPWQSLRLRDDATREEVRKRCGVKMLVEFLSRLLIDLMEARYDYFKFHSGGSVVMLDTDLVNFVLVVSQDSAK